MEAGAEGWGFQPQYPGRKGGRRVELVTTGQACTHNETPDTPERTGLGEYADTKNAEVLDGWLLKKVDVEAP